MQAMLFNIERDSGDCVVGYFVPDGFETTPHLRVRSGGVEVAQVEANELRQSLVDAGRHQTGLCGFTIADPQVPGLSGLDDLEIFDEESGLLVYRRPRGEFL